MAGTPKVLVDMDLRPTNLAWHADGQTVAFTADPDWRNDLKYNSPDLWTVSLDGKVTRLTNDGYVYGDVDYSPDGRYLSYSRAFGTDMIIEQRLNHGGPQDLYVMPAAGGEPINLTATWDLDPGPARWSPDSKFLYFTAGIGGETHLFRVSVPGARVEQVTKGPRRVTGLSYDKSFTKILYTVGLHETPADLYVANIDGSNERRLTNIHKALVSEIALSRTERLRWPSYDGTQIEGWLTFPYGYDPAKGPYPMIVTSHGGPHAATGYTFDFKDQYFAANYCTKETEFFGTPWEKDARDRMIRQSPLTYAAQVKTPTLFVHGEVDQRVPYEEGEQMYFALKRRGIPAKMIRHAGQPHGIAGNWNNVHRCLNELAWWDKYLKGGSNRGTASQGNR